MWNKSPYLPETCNFIQKKTLAQVFSSEFCEIFKNTFFTEQQWTTASIVTVFGLFISNTRNFYSTCLIRDCYVRDYYSLETAHKCHNVVYYCDCTEVFLRISQNSVENTCTKGNLQPYEKGDSGTGAFLWISGSVQEYIFYRTPPGDCFCYWESYCNKT